MEYLHNEKPSLNNYVLLGHIINATNLHLSTYFKIGYKPTT